MKKLVKKDRISRQKFKNFEKIQFVLKSIYKNSNFPMLVRWNAITKLRNVAVNNSKVSFTNRCVNTFNKKRFNKMTKFSRHVFLKLVRSGKIVGFRKSSW